MGWWRVIALVLLYLDCWIRWTLSEILAFFGRQAPISIERHHGRPMEKMIFVTDHNSRWIECEVAAQRKTWIVNIFGYFENQLCFEDLARCHFSIESVHFLSGRLISSTCSIDEHTLAADFSLCSSTRAVSNPDLHDVQRLSGHR